MELEDQFVEQQYNNHQNEQNMTGKNGYSEVLQPYDYYYDEMQTDFNENNFLFVDHYNTQYQNSQQETQQQKQKFHPNTNEFNLLSPPLSTCNSTNQDARLPRFQSQDLSQSQSGSLTDCSSQHRGDCQELLEQERQLTITTQKKGNQRNNNNNQLVVKSIVAVDVQKAPSNFEFTYGERPYVVVNPLQGFYFISGDVCILNQVFRRYEFTRFSELNSFKTPVKTEHNQKTGALEVDLNNKRTGIKNFGFLIEKMRTYSSQQTYYFANLLEQYQKVIDNLQEKKDLIKDEKSMNFYSNYLEESYKGFEQKASKILEHVAQTSTFYTYTVHRLNLFNFEMQMRKYGYSEALLALLGLDIPQAQQYVWRKGLFDFLDKENVEKMLFYLVAYKLGYTEIQAFDVVLHTFDGLDVFAVNNMQIYMNRDPNSPFLQYNEILLVNVYDINHTMIQQVMDIRKQTQAKSVKYLRDMEEDLSYSMESTIFLEKYYKSATQNFLPSNKRAGYRVIDKQPQDNQQQSN